jgi:hypothetical protein
MNPIQETNIAKTSLLLLALACLPLGCATGPGKAVPWTVQVTKITPASVEVDIAGVSKPEEGYWGKSVKMDDYWKSGSPIRQALFDRKRVVSTKFQDPKPFVLDSKDPVWQTWFGYGTYELAIFANLPGKHSNDEVDPRRLFVPLGKNAWVSKDHTLQIEILDGQIRILTPPTP